MLCMVIWCVKYILKFIFIMHVLKIEIVAIVKGITDMLRLSIVLSIADDLNSSLTNRNVYQGQFL